MRKRLGKLSIEKRIFVESKAQGKSDIEAVRDTNMDVSSLDECMLIADEWLADEDIKDFIDFRKRELLIEEMPEDHELVRKLKGYTSSDTVKTANITAIDRLFELNKELKGNRDDEIKNKTTEELEEEIREMVKLFNGEV